LLFAKVSNFNRLSFGEDQEIGSDTVSRGLEGIFTQLQLDCIENAFEISNINDNPRKYFTPELNEDGARTEESDKRYWEISELLTMSAGMFYASKSCEDEEDEENEYDPTTRLEMICQNIIDNKGEFMTSQGVIVQ